MPPLCETTTMASTTTELSSLPPPVVVPFMDDKNNTQVVVQADGSNAGGNGNGDADSTASSDSSCPTLTPCMKKNKTTGPQHKAADADIAAADVTSADIADASQHGSITKKKKTKKKKYVTFFEGVRVKEIPALVDYCTGTSQQEELEDFLYENFYNKYEFQYMQNCDKALLCLIQKEQEEKMQIQMHRAHQAAAQAEGDDDVVVVDYDYDQSMIHILTNEDDPNIENVCLRGLEGRTKIGSKRKMMNRIIAFDAVFDEVVRQYEDVTLSKFDLIKIAKCYSMYTQCSTISAIRLAKQDEEYVNEYIRPTCEYFKLQKQQQQQQQEQKQQGHQDQDKEQSEQVPEEEKQEVGEKTTTSTTATTNVKDLCLDSPQVARQRLSIQHVSSSLQQKEVIMPHHHQHHPQHRQQQQFRRRSFIGAAA